MMKHCMKPLANLASLWLGAALLLTSTSSSAETFVFECGHGVSFVVSTKTDEAWVFHPDIDAALPRVADNTYRRGNASLVITESSAKLRVGDQEHTGCKNNRRAAIWEDAKLRGVSYRAIGQEPGWELAIVTGEAIYLTTDYGELTRTFLYVEPTVNPEKRRSEYALEGGTRIVIEGQPCADSMSGETFASRVTVQQESRTLHGCGRALH
jgi:putative lipoprotein